MTLASCGGAAPRIAVEAVLARSGAGPTEVAEGTQSLLQYSFAEAHSSRDDGQEYITLPKVAALFGKKKFNVSPLNAEIQTDVETLRMLGTGSSSGSHLGLARRMEAFFSNISSRLERGETFDSYVPMLEMICRAYNPGWLVMARWHSERGTSEDFDAAKSEILDTSRTIQWVGNLRRLGACLAERATRLETFTENCMLSSSGRNLTLCRFMMFPARRIISIGYFETMMSK